MKTSVKINKKGTKMKKSIFISITTTLVLLGCSSTYSKSNREVRVNATKFSNVMILGDVLNKLVVDNTKGRRVDDKLEEAFIDINNTSTLKTSFQYRFKWYDSQGFEVGKDMSIWRTRYIEGLSQEKISEIAPVGEAYNYKCLLKKAY